MQIFDNDDRGSGTALPDHVTDNIEQPCMSCFRTESRRRSLGIGYAEKLIQERQIRLECRTDRREMVQDSASSDRRIICRGNAEEEAEKFQHGLQGGCVPVKQCTRFENRDEPAAAPLGELVTEPALAGTGRTRYPNYSRIAILGAPQGTLKHADFAIATAERCQICTAELLAGDRRFQPEQAVDLDRFREALQRVVAERAHVTVRTDQTITILGETNGPRLGNLLQPTG